MATRQEIYDAIRRADVAGDSEAVNRLSDLLRQNDTARSMTHEYRGTFDDIGRVPTDFTPAQMATRRIIHETPAWKNFAAGAGSNLARIGRWTGNKIGAVPDEDVKEAAEIDKPLLRSPSGAAGDFTGGMVWTAPAGLGATSAVSTMGRVGAGIAANPITRGALEGAVQGGLQSPKGETLKGMAFGGGAGAALPLASETIKKVAHGLTVTPEARTLLDRGVELTPGQMNAKGVANQLESSWESVPVIGPMISGARKKAENQYKQALIMEAAAPGAKLASKNDLSELLDDAYKSFDPAYAPAKKFPIQVDKSGVPVSGANRTLADDFADAVKDPGVLAANETRQTTGSWLSNQLTKKPKTTGDLIDMRSQIRAKIRSIKGTTKDDQATRDILENAEHAITSTLDNWLPQDVAAGVRAADAQYGKFKIVENAVAKGGDKDFTAFQASKAVREATDKGEYARGGGRMRDLTAAGAGTFVDRPETGARLASIGLPIAAMAAKPIMAIPAALGTAAMALTKTGRRLASGDTALQEALQQVLARKLLPDKATEYLGRALRGGTVQQLDTQPGTGVVATQ